MAQEYARAQPLAAIYGAIVLHSAAQIVMVARPTLPGPCVQEPRQVVSAWGLVVVVAADGAVTCLREKPLAAKLELLHAKSLYLVALNLAQSEQARRWRLPHTRPAGLGSFWTYMACICPGEQYMCWLPSWSCCTASACAWPRPIWRSLNMRAVGGWHA